jgi:putative ABC transport system permease protein
VFAEDRPKPQPGEEVTAGYSAVSPGFLRTAGIHLLRGREIAAGDTADAPLVVIVNERLANRLWPGRNPLGQRLQIGRKGAVGREVVGLVANVRHVGLGTAAGPEVYVSCMQSPAETMAVLVRTSGSPAAMARPIGGTVRQIDKDLPIPAVRTMAQVLAASTAKERFGMALLSCFALLALVLSGLGLYGVVAESVAQRTHEIGVRMALGAERGRVFRLMLQQGLLLCLTGIGAGLALSAMAGRVLRGLLFGVSATDAVTFFTVPALLLAVGMLACFVPAYRATRVDPMISLRAE